MQRITRIREALQSSETSATLLGAIVRKQYGDEAFDWDPLTVFLEIKADFGVELSDEGMNKFSALQVVMTSDAFFKRVDAFSSICNTLAGGEPYFVAFDPVTVEEACWAITEVALNRDMLPFTYPIKQYLYVILAEDGYDEDNDPEAIKLALEIRPKSTDIVKSAVSYKNRDNVEMYINENLKQIVREFNKVDIPIDDFVYTSKSLGKV